MELTAVSVQSEDLRSGPELSVPDDLSPPVLPRVYEQLADVVNKVAAHALGERF